MSGVETMISGSGSTFTSGVCSIFTVVVDFTLTGVDCVERNGRLDIGRIESVIV